MRQRKALRGLGLQLLSEKFGFLRLCGGVDWHFESGNYCVTVIQSPLASAGSTQPVAHRSVVISSSLIPSSLAKDCVHLSGRLQRNKMARKTAILARLSAAHC